MKNLNHYECEIIHFIATYCLPFTAGEIARKTGFSDSTVKKYLKILEQKGYVEIDECSHGDYVCKTYWSLTTKIKSEVKEMEKETFEEQFPNITNKQCVSVLLVDVEKLCIEKQRVKEAILRNFIDDVFRRQLLKELDLEDN